MRMQRQIERCGWLLLIALGALVHSNSPTLELAKGGCCLMLHSSDPRYQYCARVGKSVCVCRSEVECRREYGCIKLDSLTTT